MFLIFWMLSVIWSESRLAVSDSLWPHGLYSVWNSPGQNIGWVAFPFSRGSSQPRVSTQVSPWWLKIFCYYSLIFGNIEHSFYVFVVVQLLSHVWLCESVDCSTPVFPVLHYLPEFIQTHLDWVRDAIQPSHPLSLPSPALSLSQNQDLFQQVDSLYQVAKVLELHRFSYLLLGKLLIYIICPLKIWLIFFLKNV